MLGTDAQSLLRDVRYGDDTIRLLPGIVRSYGAGRVLLVCGRRSFEASGAAEILVELRRVAEVRRWSDFAPNADADHLQAGLAIAKQFRPDLVLGVGGGSAMDMAKLLCAFDGISERGRLDAAIRSGDWVGARAERLVLVPTTSGSGSEATHFAVVYIGEEKFSVAGDLVPDTAVLDPCLTPSGSAHQRATSGIDAVAQAIESLWASGATARSRTFARHALDLLLPTIEAYVESPISSSARAMTLGSHLAGRAIDISKTTAAHALSYGVSRRYGVSHGHAVALTLGGFIAAHADAPADSLHPRVSPAEHADAMTHVLRALGARDGNSAATAFRSLLERIGLNPSLEAAGVNNDAARRLLLETVNHERLSNNPVRFDESGLMQILHGAG